ncbi:transcriptional pleiotropic repressor [Seinonella peptonophila]|uniref:Global transcriptional regulator CodY n=1 Tax=Seinonella peptonophila TaxID=112248 RepID=A0A1M5AWU2_9BACL|nr:hypothetical protein [Seinonella peptonophila]SHF34744.1 transcriptional pleiotropic repressor [Seinonella peptonophila]
MNFLKKTQQVAFSLQEDSRFPDSYDTFTETLGIQTQSNIYVIEKGLEKRLISSYSWNDNDPINGCFKENGIHDDVEIEFEAIDKTMSNLQFQDFYFVESDGTEEESVRKLLSNKVTVVPIRNKKENLGWIILSRYQKFGANEVLLAEYGASMIAILMTISEQGKKEKEYQDRSKVRRALNSLSYSELEAANLILSELDGLEGLLVASKVADREGITRSIIVNALRKLESAGMVYSKSLGMKGTFVKVLNPNLLSAIEKVATSYLEMTV